MQLASILAATFLASALWAGSAIGASQTGRPPPARTPGAPTSAVDPCRAYILTAARALNAVRVDVVSAGREIRGVDGELRAPLKVRIVYSDGTERLERQAQVECRLDRDGRVVGLNVGDQGLDGPPGEAAAAQGDVRTSALERPQPPRADGEEVVGAFYAALGSGDGEAASRTVVPEKRGEGPLSAARITRYFGGLARPLQTQSIARLEANLFDVRYSYGIGRRNCTGSARVTLTSRGDATYIESIAAKESCS
jgi:hypothetical protein